MSTPSSVAAVRPRVLLVDDNPDAAFGLRTNLEFEGFEVVVAEDGNVALEMATRIRPALVLMDLVLPALDGFSLIRHLRAQDLTVPIMVVTGSTLQGALYQSLTSDTVSMMPSKNARN